MNKLPESLISNFSFSDIIAFLSMIGAIIAAVVAWISKRKAAESEEQAALYAKNADEANQSAKRYYDELHEHLVKQSKRADKEDLKKSILVLMNSSAIPSTRYHTSMIAEEFSISTECAYRCLSELKSDGKLDPYCGSYSDSDYDSVWWLKS